MATILQFRQTSAGERPARDAVAQAEIIIFPGVRYERWDDETAPVEHRHDDEHEVEPTPRARRRGGAAAARKRSKSQRKRDVLEIPE